MAEKKPKDVNTIAAQVVKILYEAGAARWSVRDKGILLAAVKQQLAEKA